MPSWMLITPRRALLGSGFPTVSLIRSYIWAEVDPATVGPGRAFDKRLSGRTWIGVNAALVTGLARQCCGSQSNIAYDALLRIMMTEPEQVSRQSQQKPPGVMPGRLL